MSSKEKVIEWVQKLPDNLGIPEILTALQTQCAKEVDQAKQEAEDYEWPTDDVTEEDWRLFVAQGLRPELEDPREDIYTLEDGVPENEQG